MKREDLNEAYRIIGQLRSACITFSNVYTPIRDMFGTDYSDKLTEAWHSTGQLMLQLEQGAKRLEKEVDQ